MLETGTLDKLWQKIERKIVRSPTTAEINSPDELGYENLALPFLALLFGVCVAFLLYGIEAVAC